MPLLSRAPLAQNELVKSSRGVTVLLARFHNAPHAEWPLTCSGSLEARSKKRTRFGETTMDSRATMPESTCFKSNRHPGADGAALTTAEKRERRGVYGSAPAGASGGDKNGSEPGCGLYTENGSHASVGDVRTTDRLGFKLTFFGYMSYNVVG